MHAARGMMARLCLPSAARSLLARPRLSRAIGSNAKLDPAKRLEARKRARRGERADSVNESMEADRKAHAEAITAAWPEQRVIDHIRELKLGRQPGWHHQGMVEFRRLNVEKTLGPNGITLLGKTGMGMHSDWGRLNQEKLPEVAIMGHANCGKSTLLNALAGTRTRKGPAAVSSRAGWTAELSFFKLVHSRVGAKKRAQVAAKAAIARVEEQEVVDPAVGSSDGAEEYDEYDEECDYHLDGGGGGGGGGSGGGGGGGSGGGGG